MKQDPFRDFVLDQLQPCGKVTSRAMFGGHGLYARDAIFGIVYRGALYLKIDGEARAALIKLGSTPFCPAPAKKLASYWRVPDDILEDRDELKSWVVPILPR